MAETDFPSVPFSEAIAALKRRGIVLQPTDRWTDMWQEEHQRAFTVARSAGFDILDDIHSAMVAAREQGLTFRDFAQDLTPTLQKKGWWGRIERVNPATGEVESVQLGSMRRLRTIFDVNMRTSSAQGRWEQFQRTREAFPYLCYECVLDGRTRPLHRSWHRRTLPIDHPWWKTHFPPNGWYCRCAVFAVSEDDIQRMGLKISDPGPDRLRPWINPATGEIMMVPEGIDPGWDYNPGNTDAAAHAAKAAMDKLVDLPPSLGAEAATRLAFAFPQVERELGEWLERVATETLAPVPFRGRGERRVVGCITSDILTWLEEKGIAPPQTAAITIRDWEVGHLLREAKRERGNALDLDEIRRLPTLLMQPDAVLWEMGETVGKGRKPALIYVWKTGTQGLGKIVVKVSYETRVAKADRVKWDKKIITNTIQSARIGLNAPDFPEAAGFMKISGDL